MNLVRCEKGHFYDKDKNGRLPRRARPLPLRLLLFRLLLPGLVLLSPIQLLLLQLPHRTRRQGLQFLLLNPSSLSPLRGLPLLSHPALPLRYRQQRRRPDRRLPQTA